MSDVCGVCSGSGFYRVEIADVHDPRYGKLLPCACKARERAGRMQAAFGSVLDAGLRLSDFRARGDGSRRMQAVGKKFIAHPVGLVTVYGERIAERADSSANGNGKTTWAQALVNECVERGTAALYVTASDLMSYVNAGINDAQFGVEARIDKLSAAPVLAIDELTQIKRSDWVDEKLILLIDRRYKRADTLGTILAMDDNPRLALHRRLVSRIFAGVVIRNSDADMRPLLGGNVGGGQA